MVLRSVGIVLYARQLWPVRVGWAGALFGTALPAAALWMIGI
jgi:hypothetical protein